MNPNNCATCDHKKRPDGGHCYMFRDEPTDVCMQHTGRNGENMGKMTWMDAEELAMHVLGLDENAADDVDFDDLMYDKFEISMEQFHKIAEALSDFTVPMQAGISGKMFRGFVKDDYFITKDEVPSNA